MNWQPVTFGQRPAQRNVAQQNYQLSLADESNTVYQLQLINNIGQTIYSSNIKLNGRHVSKSIDLKGDIAAGSYLLIITSEKTEKIIIN